MNTLYNIKETVWPERTFIIKKESNAISRLRSFFSEQYAAIYAGLAKKGVFISEAPFALTYSGNMDGESTIAAAVPVKDPDIKLNGFETITLPPSQVVAATHIGEYDKRSEAYQALEQYLDNKGLEKALVLEEFVSDPTFESDQSKRRTVIYFMVKK